MIDKLPHELLKRTGSAVIIAIVFVVAIFYSPMLFNVILLVMLWFMLSEWYQINKTNMLDVLYGCILIPVAIISLYFIYNLVPSILMLAYFMATWATDTMAMIGGRLIGGPRLAPIISPKKTWSGLLSGIAGAVITVMVMEHWLDKSYNVQALIKHCDVKLLAVIVAVVSQLSDLLVSIFKRKHRVKDSGHIIPGHGGMLDRFDSIILTSPLMLALLLQH